MSDRARNVLRHVQAIEPPTLVQVELIDALTSKPLGGHRKLGDLFRKLIPSSGSSSVLSRKRSSKWLSLCQKDDKVILFVTKLSSRNHPHQMKPSWELLQEKGKVHSYFVYLKEGEKKPCVGVRQLSKTVFHFSFGKSNPHEDLRIRILDGSQWLARLISGESRLDESNEREECEHSPDEETRRERERDTNQRKEEDGEDEEEEAQRKVESKPPIARSPKALALLACNDPHAVLGIPPNANRKTIRSAYRRQALMWHPDKNTSPEAAECFSKVHQAFAILMQNFPPSSVIQPSADQNDGHGTFSFGSSESFGSFRQKKNNHSHASPPPPSSPSPSNTTTATSSSEEGDNASQPCDSREPKLRRVKSERGLPQRDYEPEQFRMDGSPLRIHTERRKAIGRRGIDVSQAPMELAGGSNVEIFHAASGHWIPAVVEHIAMFLDSFTVADSSGKLLEIHLGCGLLVRSATTRGPVSLSGVSYD